MAMESKKRDRKPLSDCTNTTLSSQSSDSNFAVAIKPRKRVLIKSVVKHVVNNETKRESSYLQPNPRSDSISTEPSSCSLPVEASTPLPSCSGADRVSEPKSFYSRRNPTNKRKSVGITDAPFIFSSASKIQTRVEKRDGYSSPPKVKTVPYRKRQRGSIYGEYECEFDLPREFVEHQKAYFSEIDAFELPMEEAKSSDSE